jgi:hypothetical protein
MGNVDECKKRGEVCPEGRGAERKRERERERERESKYNNDEVHRKRKVKSL